jgi:hypothetical protein
MKPTFLFIGPDKTGSSWLYQILRHHPNCFVPDCKDIYFFDRYYHRGFGWYLSIFKDVPSNIFVVGELSHDYLFSAVVANRIKHDLPGVKLLTILRDPVERTFSHYLYMIRSGRTRDEFELALENFPELINNSMYYKHLSEYFCCFERQQIKVLFFEALKADPKAFAKEVFDFLNLPLIDEIDYYSQVLPASHPQSYLLARLAKLSANAARDIGLTNLVGIVKHSPLTQLLYRPYKQNERPVMSLATKTRLNSIFQSDIMHLQDLLDVDLSRWLIVNSGG